MKSPVLWSSCFALSLAIVCGSVDASDWSRFRGPNGLGVSSDTTPVPIEWSEFKNLKWKVQLPGKGLSSPIVVGNRVFVTCWSGYGIDSDNIGVQLDLKRHLICVDRESGKTLWSQVVEAVLPEQPFLGQFTENGYATHTPVSDGERVYVFFGKTGVIAFDMDGTQLWHHKVGMGDDAMGRGSAASPILYKDLLIVPAAMENSALIALDKRTGEVKWQKEAQGFAATFSTPALVDLPDGRQELVLSVPFELWGFNPDTGKLQWYCESPCDETAASSAVAHDGMVYVIEGRGGGSIAIRAGGQGDVTNSHVVWTGRDRSQMATPLLHEGRLYWINAGVANCIEAKTGKQVFQGRIRRSAGETGGAGRGGFGFGGQDYSSPVAADGKLYCVMRSGETVVLKLGDKFEQLGLNRFESDSNNYSATPAISDGEIFLRSNSNLYCISTSK